MIFVNDVNKCYKLKLFFQQFFINTAVLNAEVPLNSRLHILEEFNRGVFDYLIATDASIDKGGEEEHDGSDIESEEEEEEEEEEESGDEGEGDSDEEAAIKSAKKSAASKKDAAKQKNAKAHSNSKSAEVDYGVSRGIDFQGVNFVVNFDFPASASAYTHRVGRTGRGGATGTALSFVATTAHAASSTTASAAPASEVAAAARDAEVLQVVREQQPRLNATGTSGNVLGAISTGGEETFGEGSAQAEEERRMQPAPLQFNFKELETFRYRVEDTLRSVTGTAVKELRSAELKREILNSEKLKSFFAENPNDLKVLRHDKAIAHPIRQKDHLKSVPEYLMPISMRGVSNVRTNSKRGKKRKTTATTAVAASKKRNPLYNASAGEGEADAGASNDAAGGDEGGEEGGDPTPEFSNGSDALNSTASGRKQWQMRHKKGVFNPKAAKKNEHRTPGSFIKSKNYKK